MFNERCKRYRVYNQHVYTTTFSLHLYRADWMRHNTFKSVSMCQSMLVVGNARRRHTIQNVQEYPYYCLYTCHASL